MNLKPQDVVVALKLSAYPEVRPAISIIASDISFSPSEVHEAIGRLRGLRLLHEPNLKGRRNFSALEEFLVHRLNYAFPAEHGKLARGIPTSNDVGYSKFSERLKALGFLEDRREEATFVVEAAKSGRRCDRLLDLESSQCLLALHFTVKRAGGTEARASGL